MNQVQFIVGILESLRKYVKELIGSLRYLTVYRVMNIPTLVCKGRNYLYYSSSTFPVSILVFWNNISSRNLALRGLFISIFRPGLHVSLREHSKAVSASGLMTLGPVELSKKI